MEGYTEEQIKDAKKIIDALLSVPAEKRPMLTAIATAYIDGIETGTRINRDMEGVTA